MKTSKSILMATILALLAAAASAADTSKPLSGTRYASAVVKITADSGNLALDINYIYALIKSSPVAQKAYDEIFGGPPHKVSDLIKTVMPLRPGRSVRRAEGADLSPEMVFEIDVAIPEDVPGGAEEFIAAIIKNLRSVLEDTAKTERQKLTDELAIVIAERKAAQERLDEIRIKTDPSDDEPPVDPADAAAYEQLDTIVDLSVLRAGMELGQALEAIKNSMKPPLQIIVNWRDLTDSADIEPTTPIDICPISGVKLAAVLDRMLDIAGGGFVKLDYAIDGGVITIATVGSLPQKMITRTYTLPPGPPAEISEIIQEIIEPDTWSGNGGQGTIQVYQGRNLIVRQSSKVHKQISDLLQDMKAALPARDISIPEVPAELLLSRKQDLLRDKQKLETDVARLNARRKAIEQQLSGIRSKLESKLADDVVMKELQRILDMAIKRQKSVGPYGGMGQATSEEARAAEQIARTKIEMAQRRGQLAKEAGGDLLARFSGELANIAVDLAENQAMLEVTDRQIAEVDSQLAAAAADEPYKSELRVAKEALQAATIRANEIQSRLESLRPPTVTIIGAN